MIDFKYIDIFLEQFSDTMGAELTKNRSNYPHSLRSFQERRIDWKENDIRKAIIIQPLFGFKCLNKINGVL